MPPPFTPQGSLIWSLAHRGPSTTLTTSGNAGAWDSANARGPSRLHPYSDLGLFVSVAGPASGSLKVQLDVFDDLGNLFPAVMATAALTGPGSAAPVYAGLHGAGASAYLVIPEYGRVSWVISGGSPSFAGVQIALYGR